MLKTETLLAQSGLCKDSPVGAISTPIYQCATFRHPALGKSTGYDYSRTANPTRTVLEDAVAVLENGAGCTSYASGMAALTALLSIFAQGDHFIVSDDLYGGTFRLFEAVFSRFGITASYVDMTRIGAIEKAFTPKTKALLIETPTNPIMKITDIRAVAALAKTRNCIAIVDNTFMSPYCQKPLELGADVVVHSGTKFLAGHNDVLCGFVVTKSEETAARMRFIQNATGGVLSPNDSWLVLRGLKTLAVRMDRAAENAAKISEFLVSHKRITKVYYPGLRGHDGYDVHAKQSNSSGAMISFRLADASRVPEVINRVKVISFAESLGGVESLITYPCMQTHGDIPKDIREKIGVTEDLLRLSVGIEHVDDLIEDLEQALN